MTTIRKAGCLAVIACVASLAAEGAPPFPGDEWEYIHPEESGWSSDRLEAAQTYAATIDTAALMVVHEGRVVCEWGNTKAAYLCHSMRKSILSVLIGIAVAENAMSLDASLADLGIDDNEPSLTTEEKTATVRDLIRARSGVYHAALAETPKMTANKPARGSHTPGTYWYYNNWDFNALGTIYRQETGQDIYQAFDTRIATPLGMQDWNVSKHGNYLGGEASVHPAYHFRLSARDLARFGLMMARNGRWNDRQLVPESWVAESTKSHSEAGEFGGYGYMWWISGGAHGAAILPPGSYSAQGTGGHILAVIPDWDVVLVHRVNTSIEGKAVTLGEFTRLLQLILAARPAALGTGFSREVPSAVIDEPEKAPF